MDKRCTVCNQASRPEIDRQLIRGVPYHALAVQYGLSASALRSNNVRFQDAQFQALLVTYQNTGLSAQQDVEDNLAGFLRSQEQAAVLKESVQAAQSSLNLAVIQYREGLPISLPSQLHNRPSWSVGGWRTATLPVIATFLAVLACGEENVYAPPPPPQVTVAHPTRQPVVDYLEFTGNTQAINTVQLRARVQGFLEKIYCKDGDLVKKGQMLCLIQPNTYQDQLEQAEAQVLQQKANYDHAVIETARYTRLVKQRAAAQTDLEWQTDWISPRITSRAKYCL